MDLLQLGILSATSFLVGFSGALIPQAVFVAVVVQVAKKGWLSIPLIVVGHGILELALTAALISGLSVFMQDKAVQSAIGVFGGFFLVWMGGDLISNARRATLTAGTNHKEPRITRLSPILTGLLASSVSPYFYLWWATVGNMFMLEGLKVAGLIGAGVFFISHWMSDLSWYTVVSVSISRGRKVMTDRTYRAILGSCGLLILALGIVFVWSGMQSAL